VLLKKEAVWEAGRLKRFLPTKPQGRFLKSKKRIRVFLAGNKSGKTTAGVIGLLRFALQGGKVCRVIGSLGFEKGIRDVLVPEIKKWLPKDRLIKEKPNSQGITIKMFIRGDNGKESILSFMSGEQEDMAFEGDMIDYCLIDEPCRKAIYIASLRGLIMSSGPMVLTLTPLEEPWIYNDVFLSKDPEIEVIQGSIYDAQIENGGFLTKEQIESFVSKLPEDEKPARIYGDFKHLIGRVYGGYDPKIHVIRKFPIPLNWPVWCGIDPHQRKENAAAWMAVSPDENWYIVNEVWFKGGIEDFGKEVLNVSKQYKTVCHVIDTSSETPDWNRRETARSILSKVGIQTRLARKKGNKEVGRLIIQQALEGRDGTDTPWLYVFETCKRAQFEFLNYVWDNHRNPDQHGIKEEPRKINDDILDILNYIVVEKPRYSSPRTISL